MKSPISPTLHETVLDKAPDRKHAALAVLLLLSALLTAYVLLIEPVVLRYRALAETLDATLLQEQKYMALIARRPQLEAQIEALDSKDSDTAVLFSGVTASIAGANLASRMREIVEAAGGEVRSSRTRQPNEELDLTRIEVSMLAQLPFSALTEVLGEMELGKPYIFLDDVSIRSQQGNRGGGRADTIDLQLNGRGYTDLKRQ